MRLDQTPLLVVKRYVEDRQRVLRKALESLLTDEKTTHIIRGQLHELFLLSAALDDDGSSQEMTRPPSQSIY